MAHPRSVLLIITGSIAAYKSLELIRLLREGGSTVHAILTKGGAQFITPLAVSSLTGTHTYSEFSLTDEVAMGHIELSRIADLVLVAPCSADFMAKMANGLCDDLASTAVLATNKPVWIAPAMNHKMWSHAATQRNLAQIMRDGIRLIAPTEGSMACGETGIGRMAEPAAILAALNAPLPRIGTLPLAGKKAVVTSGTTHEPVDPVRYLANRASGKQGHAIAAALAAQGAEVTLITGPSAVPDPAGVKVLHVTLAEAMYKEVLAQLPADIFVSAAAVADWRLAHVAPQKIKKHGKVSKLTLDLIPTHDILREVAHHAKRPALVIGFAAETENVLEHAQRKRETKGCDWILANDVSGGKVFGADDNQITFVRPEGAMHWPKMSKHAAAEKLAQEIIGAFAAPTLNKRKSK